jgi:hypothetical protein
MPRDGGDDLRSGSPESRSELLRNRLRRFTDQVAMAGKTAELFELEMWLRSFERFFRIGAQPLSDRETRAMAARNWSEELRLVDNALLRVVQLSTSILSEEQVDLARFDRYVESNLNTEEGLDPYIEKLVRHAMPETALTLLQDPSRTCTCAADLALAPGRTRRSTWWARSSTGKCGAATLALLTRCSARPRPHATAP